ncbi:MAG: cell division protein FtsZ [Bacteroides sp.]|nr:cell division protein FtsZ [Bacteroides sp.]
MMDTVPFDIPNDSPRIIKVIGVGGGGGNAVKHMYRQGINDVTFVLCNTDSQALKKSDIPVKVQLGRKTTGGLGAGNDPMVAREAAEESIEEIRALFNDGTQMVFITAGMGGGTGTGAAPVVAREAKAMGMLTVGIVTIPFIFEKQRKIIQALKGVEEMRECVDALLVINNERLREIYNDGMTTNREAFAKADDVLTVATRSITEIITMEGIINLDFRDVKKVLKDGGVAIMSTGKASGENRLRNAIEDALHSPLLNNNKITSAKKILFNISANENVAPILIEEMNEIDAFMDSLDPDIEVIWGQADDSTLDTEVKFTVLATGFDTDSVPGMSELHQEQTEEERVQREEQAAKERELIDVTYGRTPTKKIRKHNQVHLFRIEDLDNSDLIAMLERTPTYKRDKATLADIINRSATAAQPSASAQPGEGEEIVF